MLLNLESYLTDISSPGLGLFEESRVAVGAFPPGHQIPLRHHHRGQRPYPRDAEIGKKYQYISS